MYPSATYVESGVVDGGACILTPKPLIGTTTLSLAFLLETLSLTYLLGSPLYRIVICLAELHSERSVNTSARYRLVPY